MKFALPSTVASPQDLSDLILDIREYSKWYSHNAIKKDSSKKTDNPDISNMAKEMLRQYSESHDLNASGISDLIDELESFKSNAPVISVTLAAVPPGDLKRDIVEWSRSNLNPNTLVKFQFNATILGGIVVKCGSRIFDWSFRSKIMSSRNKPNHESTTPMTPKIIYVSSARDFSFSSRPSEISSAAELRSFQRSPIFSRFFCRIR